MNQIDQDMTKTTTMETTSCLLCDADDFEPLYTLKDYYTGQPGQFRQVKCRQCGLVYLNPRPTIDSIDNFYSSGCEYLAVLEPAQLSWLKKRLIQYGLWKRCRPLLKTQKTGTVLDIGCGTGYFLAEMKRSNWQTVGIDLNANAVQVAREVRQLEVHLGKVEDSDFAENSFDAITMWDTLEHIHNPRRILTKVHHILKPGGYLLVKVPSFDSLGAKVFGDYWAGLDAPRHMTVFSRQTLARLLHETGFAAIRSWSLASSYSIWIISLKFLLAERQKNKGLEWSYKTLASPPGHLLSAPFFFLIDRIWPGSDITILAQKQP